MQFQYIRLMIVGLCALCSMCVCRNSAFSSVFSYSFSCVEQLFYNRCMLDVLTRIIYYVIYYCCHIFAMNLLKSVFRIRKNHISFQCNLCCVRINSTTKSTRRPQTATKAAFNLFNLTIASLRIFERLAAR